MYNFFHILSNGTCWTVAQANRFKNAVYNALENHGYTITPSDLSGGCPTLSKKGFREKLSLYMHPNEFSGYATEEQIQDICNILKRECADVCMVTSVRKEEVYDMTEDEYEEVLAENSPAIIEWMRTYKRNHPNSFYMDMEFAERFRPKLSCFSACGGRSSSDVDCKFIRNLEIIAEKNGLL